VTVAALVGTRIYPEQAPDEADLPLIVYTVKTADGVDGDAPVVRCTVTANCYAATDDDADALGAAVRAVLNEYAGAATGVRLHLAPPPDYSEFRDPEIALWGRLLTFSGWIVIG
jgi:hypothetical protein